MNRDVKKHIDDLSSTDDKVRLNALQTLLKLTETPVDWAYEVWDLLLEKLENENSYQRSIGIMLLCNLAKSDSEDRLKLTLDRLLFHTKDEKFITSRQCIQNIWKAAATTRTNREKVLKHLEKRFMECEQEKHYNLLRQDMIQSFVMLNQHTEDRTLLARARALVEKEQNAKYRKQYEALIKVKWRIALAEKI
jgi:hypothetical protein